MNLQTFVIVESLSSKVYIKDNNASWDYIYSSMSIYKLYILIYERCFKLLALNYNDFNLLLLPFILLKCIERKNKFCESKNCVHFLGLREKRENYQNKFGRI